MKVTKQYVKFTKGNVKMIKLFYEMCLWFLNSILVTLCFCMVTLFCVVVCLFICIIIRLCVVWYFWNHTVSCSFMVLCPKPHLLFFQPPQKKSQLSRLDTKKQDNISPINLNNISCTILFMHYQKNAALLHVTAAQHSQQSWIKLMHLSVHVIVLDAIMLFKNFLRCIQKTYIWDQKTYTINRWFLLLHAESGGSCYVQNENLRIVIWE